MAAEPTWEELLGSKNWDGLLDPFNLHLRNLILSCGDLSQTVGDAFNNDNSTYAGAAVFEIISLPRCSFRYGKKNFFDKVMLEKASDYEFKSFLYAPTKLVSPKAVYKSSTSLDSWDRDSNMIGYIAVTTDAVSQGLGSRKIYIVWRGTVTDDEWINDFDRGLISASELVRNGEHPKKMPKVMTGWLKMYVSSNPDSTFTNLSAREQMWKKMKELINQYKGENLSIIVTGHSLGASLATLTAFDLVENGIRDIHVAAFVFSSPHVGDQFFKDRVEMYPNLKVLRTFDTNDVVPTYPQTLLFEYKSVGVELKIDRNKSPYLKTNWLTHHNLQGLLHAVAGWNGENEPFDLNGRRSLALANWDADLLMDDFLIPVSWWVEKNKGMIRDEKGEWIYVQDEPEPEY